MYKYYLLLRGRSIGTQPDGYSGWTDYAARKFVPEIGREAWGELYYEKSLTAQQVRDYDLYDAGEVAYIEYMDGYKTDGVEMRGVHGMTLHGSGSMEVSNPEGSNLKINYRR